MNNINFFLDSNKIWLSRESSCENTIELIQNEIDEVLQKNNFLEIINFLKNYYNIYSDFYTDIRIKKLFSNKDFLEFVNNYLKINIKNILNSNEINSFEEMNFYFFLIWQWNFTHILLDINNYDYDQIWKIFIFLFDKIKYFYEINDKNSFNIYLNYYSNIFELLNTLCIFNEVDDKRKDNIPKLLHEIKKYNLEIVHFLTIKWVYNSQTKINFDWYESRMLLNFSHIFFQEKDLNDKYWNNIDEVLDNAINIVKNQIDGFNIALLSNFWWDISEKKYFEIIFLWNLNYIISSLYFYIKNNNLDIKDIVSTPNFIEFKKLFFIIWNNFNFFDKFILYKINDDNLSLNDLNLITLKLYSDIYNKDNDTNFKNIQDIITNFISIENINNFDIETIYNILKNSDILSNIDIFIALWKYLLSTDKFNNYNFEYFKLKIFILISDNLNISKLESSKIQDFLYDILSYIEKTKDISQLLNIYSKLYLSLSNSYIDLWGDENFRQSLKNYFIFLKIHILNEDSVIDNKKIQDFFIKVWIYKLGDKNLNLSHEDMVKLWEIFVQDFLESYEFELKTRIHEELSIITEEFLKDDIKWNITNEISLLLSKNIFFWLAKTYIINETNNDWFIKKLHLENWILYKELILFNWYKLVFAYTRIYENIFLNIFNQEKDYITRNISNIISSYIKRRSVFIDEKTWFLNETKLKNDLLSIWEKKEKWTLLVIRLKNISHINHWYWYYYWDKYIKDVWDNIQKILLDYYQIYKLNWTEYAIFIKDLNTPLDLSILIDSIKKIKIKFFKNNIKVDSYIWYVESDNIDLLEKAQIAVLECKKNTLLEWVCKFSNNLKRLQFNRINLDILSELDEAIENDRLEIAWQKIIDSKTKEIYKQEILLRIREQDWKIGNFQFKYLQVAEIYWRLRYITDIVIRKTFEYIQINWWKASINITWNDILDKNFWKMIFQIAQNFWINPNDITLEILEWNIFWEDFIKNLKSLKGMWFKIAMDDFWADNSNFNRLIDLLWIIDYLKIDWKIIKNLILQNWEVNKIIYNLLHWIVKSCKESWVKTIAEYIENEELSNICEEIWIDYLQWYHYSKPEILKNN